MSVAAAKNLYVRMVADQAFALALDQAGTLDERLRIARAAGYDFDRSEFEQATADLLHAGSLEDALGAEGDEVVGYTAIALLGIQRATVSLYGVGWFYDRSGTGAFKPGDLGLPGPGLGPSAGLR